MSTGHSPGNPGSLGSPERDTGTPLRWRPPRDILHADLSRRLGFDVMAVWLLDPGRPKPDELLARTGLDPAQVRGWCDRGHEGDGLLRGALDSGRATGTLADSGLGDVAPSMQATYHALQEMVPRQRWWLVMLARQGAPFSLGEQDTLDLLLRHWQASLNRSEDPEAARALVGHDERLISADPTYHEMLITLGVSSHEILGELRRVREQRWEEIEDDVGHDAVLEIGGRPYWFIFRRTRAVDLPEAAQWHIDISPGDPEGLPAVGALADARIAQAIGYIHDQYAESPSLGEIAKRVHVSQYHFHRVFTRLVGVSPKRYLQLRQMQIAKRMLRRSHAPIQQIAERTGFSSHGQFTATFRRLTGMSPSDYRSLPAAG